MIVTVMLSMLFGSKNKESRGWKERERERENEREEMNRKQSKTMTAWCGVDHVTTLCLVRTCSAHTEDNISCYSIVPTPYII